MVIGLRWRVALVVLALVVVTLAVSGTVDRAGYDYTERSFKRALVTFAVARGLNAVISVAQGTEIAVEPAGVGVNFTPGQVLDPVNDLVERFSWVMLASATALGVQRLLLEVFAAQPFTWLLVAVWLAAVLTLWWRGAAAWLQSLLWRLALVLMVLRFAVPLIALGSELLYSAFLHEHYTTSTARIEQVTGTIRQINQGAEQAAPTQQELSMMERARRMYESAVAAIDVRGYINRYEQAASEVSEQVINLIVVFLAQTVLLPLLLIWVLARGMGWLWRVPLPLLPQKPALEMRRDGE